MKALHTTILTTALAIAVLASPFASAHASLQSSTPEAGAILATSPTEITLTFNEEVEQTFSKITLANASGKVVPAGKMNADSANAAVLHMEVPVLASGAYTVTWAVAGHDGHRRKGNFEFSVK